MASFFVVGVVGLLATLALGAVILLVALSIRRQERSNSLSSGPSGRVSRTMLRTRDYSPTPRYTAGTLARR
ncbi:MAG TPA: hypothetical protein VN969_42170 [Streptosporangiaceae bacterium]|jgi:hypothetical protein|nr:hypothetical protein [Streptosporangiaceae bacterium]